MIPLRDNIPTRITPFVTYGLLAANIAVYLLQLTSPDRHLAETLGLKPAYVLSWLHGAPVVADSLKPVFGGVRRVSVEIHPTSFFWTFAPYFTSMFLHGGILHIAGNMLFLWIFADNVEEEVGHGRFLVLYIAAGLAGGIIQTLADLHSAIPTIGASGAIAGVLGAYFIRFPRARVLSLIPLFLFIYVTEVPAIIFLGLWFLLQIWEGLSGTGGMVAVWAHAGGFIAGILLFQLLRRRKRRPPDRYIHYEIVR